MILFGTCQLQNFIDFLVLIQYILFVAFALRNFPFLPHGSSYLMVNQALPISIFLKDHGKLNSRNIKFDVYLITLGK